METKTRIYLSGAISGVADYKDDFEKVETELCILGHNLIINPSQLDVVIVNGEYEEYMDVCIKLIDMCDIVIMLPGWQKSAGANRELGYAMGKGKMIVDWEKRGKEWRI